ncbi:MAG: DUF2141 domain-containing protein [Cyclobacteriaceae bacterium]
MLTLLILISTLNLGGSTVTLDVEVQETRGQILVAIYDKENKFMEDAVMYAKADVTGKKTRIPLELPDGEYAITIFQDLNNNEELDTNFIGIPSEPYGFSNNARGQFGPPKYEQCKFEVKGNSTMTVSLF